MRSLSFERQKVTLVLFGRAPPQILRILTYLTVSLKHDSIEKTNKGFRQMMKNTGKKQHLEEGQVKDKNGNYNSE